MANLTYLTHADNKLVAATNTVSSEDATYTKANLISMPISKPFRFTGKASENIQIDLLSAYAITFIALVNHNLSSGATVTITSGASANPAGNSQTMTWRSGDMYKIFAAQNYRYWKIVFADAGSTASVIQLGYVMVGISTTLGFNFTYGWSITDEYQNYNIDSGYGVPHIAELYSRSRLSLPFRSLGSTNAATLRAFYQTVKMNVTPVFLVPDADQADCYFGRFDLPLTRVINYGSGSFYGAQDAQLSFVSDSRGRTLSA
jgi:hypothetical protein